MVNTVNFSNHAGYGRSGGTKTTAAELNATFESMEYNELLMPTRLLTGKDDFPGFLFFFASLTIHVLHRVYTRCRISIGHPQNRRKTQA